MGIKQKPVSASIRPGKTESAVSPGRFVLPDISQDASQCAQAASLFYDYFLCSKYGYCMIKTALILAALLFPFASVAGPGSFIFEVDGTKETYSPECIKSISYLAGDEIDSENVNFSLSDVCGKIFYQTTKKNIGKKLSVYYKGNLLSSANIVSVLRNNFRFSSKDMPRMVLMQLLYDYGVKHN
ncbi:SecDF P1 head subdomain-containing protein [Pantoea dispersa]|uniref:SecDF P1 head subdomain-containing protein n=1 Tax=Pantoea dispersa TaxID=59814 RepID=UPI00128F0059|nr:hypothetical protein [Pantoea dispersa]